MLLFLTEYLTRFHTGFNVFGYITMRGILGALTALLMALILGPMLIERLTSRQVGQVVRADGPQSHLPKAGTPTMGGALILLSVLLATLLWADLRNRFVWIVMGVTLAFGIVGFVDDYRKMVLGNSRGLPASQKFFWQSVIALVVALLLYFTADDPIQTSLLIPYLPSVLIPLGLLFIPLVWLMLVGFSNAVNLTDGLDGLAIMPTVLVAGGLAILAYVAGHFTFSEYLGLPFIRGTGELMVFCAALCGAGLGFLWFNTYPAQVFMGDVGSLALGAALGIVAVLTRQEVVLIIMGGVFVLETLSVMIQVASFRLTGRRVFRMAPIHHHFELKGWAEPKVIVRFWIITVILVLIGLSSLKIR